MDNKLGQLFFIGVEGTELSSKEADFIVNNNIGGVTLFGRNCEDPQQLHKLCSDIQALRHKLPDKQPIFIGIDMEGGRVHRLKAPFTQWPAVRKIGQANSTSIAFKFSNMMGRELRSVGIHLDYAPCLDVDSNPNNPVIGDRSLGPDPEEVSKLGSALVRGYIKAGIIPCAKHYPGHGNTNVDSHEELPIEEVSLDQMNDRELIPFKKVFRARLDFVMTAHIKYQNVDPDNPATFSEKFMNQILRDELKYRNLVITDDLGMKALTNHYEVDEIPVKAMQAGCNIMLYCNDFDHPPIGLEAVRKAIADGKISQEHIQFSVEKMEQIKKEKLTDPDPIDFSEASKLIGHPEHLKVAKAIDAGDIPEDLIGT